MARLELFSALYTCSIMAGQGKSACLALLTTREGKKSFNGIFAAARIQTWALALQASAQSITLWPLRMIVSEVFDLRYYCQD